MYLDLMSKIKQYFYPPLKQHKDQRILWFFTFPSQPSCYFYLDFYFHLLLYSFSCCFGFWSQYMLIFTYMFTSFCSLFFPELHYFLLSSILSWNVSVSGSFSDKVFQTLWKISLFSLHSNWTVSWECSLLETLVIMSPCPLASVITVEKSVLSLTAILLQVTWLKKKKQWKTNK